MRGHGIWHTSEAVALSGSVYREGGKAWADCHLFAELLSASVFTVNDKLCHGLVGVAEEVVDYGERWDQPAWLRDFLQVHSAARCVESCIQLGLGFCQVSDKA